jgi:hypothetical protein
MAGNKRPTRTGIEVTSMLKRFVARLTGRMPPDQRPDPAAEARLDEEYRRRLIRLTAELSAQTRKPGT